MAGSRQELRGLRFTSLRFDADAVQAGLQIHAGGGLAMVSEDAAVRQSIMLLLCTRPGERVMRPAYGCDLQELLYHPNNATTQGLAIHYVRQALQRFEPRVELVDLDARRNPDAPAQLDVFLRYTLRRTLTVADLNFSLALQETG